MTTLHRGPDKYARPDLRVRIKRIANSLPMMTERQSMEKWRAAAMAASELLEDLRPALDRLDDAEALLEGRDP